MEVQANMLFIPSGQKDSYVREDDHKVGSWQMSLFKILSNNRLV